MNPEMSFYQPTDSEFNRRYKEEVEIIFSGIDCVLHRQHVIYCSSELSSGFRLYAALREFKLMTSADLRKAKGADWYQSQIWDRNVQSAIDFAEEVRCGFTDSTIVVTPAPFTAPKWSQPEYLYFWETLLRTRIKSVWFNRNWQFSNGCAFEFAVALDAGLPTLDRDGKPLERSVGIKLIESAIRELEHDGFDAAKLHENLGLLQARTRVI
jgi:hypothetical protein